MNDCIFCKIAAGEIPSRTLYENDRVRVFLDISPMAKGHALVVPKAHADDLADTSDAFARDVQSVVRVVTRAMLAAGATGVNVLQNNGASAGQTVRHLHVHVIPRDGGAAQPAFESGAGAYASDEEADAWAANLRAAIKAEFARGNP